MQMQRKLSNVAGEYLNSARRLRERIDRLRMMQQSKHPEEQKKLEERIMLLNVEYYELIRTASYLRDYYCKAPTVSLKDTEYRIRVGDEKVNWGER